MYKCRVCLIKCEEDQISCMDLEDNFPVLSDSATILQALSEIANVTISEGYHIKEPSKICSSCFYRLQDAYIFIKRAQESAAIIKQCASIGRIPMALFHTTPPIADNHENINNTNEVGSNTNEEEKELGSEIRNCFENIQIASIQSYTDAAIDDVPLESMANYENGDNESIVLNECDIKKEIDSSVSQEDEQNGTENRVDKMCQTSDDFAAIEERLSRCACKYFHRADFISQETKQIIRDRFQHMDNDVKNLYLRSLIHACRCGEGAKSAPNDAPSTNEDPLSLSKDKLVVIHTLECNGEYFSVDRETFLDVFNMEVNASISLDANNGLYKYENTQNLEPIVSKEMDNTSQASNDRVSSDEDMADEDQAQQCMLCSRNFKGITSLKRHVILNHSYTNEKTNNEKSVGENGLLREIKKIKVKRRSTNHSLPCSYCFRKFATTAALISHKKYCFKLPKKKGDNIMKFKKIRVKLGTAKRSLPCSHCSRKFCTTAALISHKKFCFKVPKNKEEITSTA